MNADIEVIKIDCGVPMPVPAGTKLRLAVEALNKMRVAKSSKKDQSFVCKDIKVVNRAARMTGIPISHSKCEGGFRVWKTGEATDAKQFAQFETLFNEFSSVVAEVFDVNRQGMVGRGRSEAVTVPRHALQLLLRESGMGTPTIGSLMSDRDHTTVIASCKQAQNLEDTDTGFRERLAKCRGRLARYLMTTEGLE